ncbi:MAG: hypothetical protein EA411_02865 [Saprospirales bacterium]|nr:MAG: hypothetical protein EA411_02865 [Saprospirales bacterium]
MGVLFVSCEKDSIQLNDQIDPIEYQTSESEYRSSSPVDSFRLYLIHLADMFYSGNEASEGELALLLETFDTISSSSAFEILDSSGLIDVVQLESTIVQTAHYEDLLLESYSQEDIENMVNADAGDLQELFGRPFWGDDCETSLVGGVSDGECVHMTLCENRYRFWINFGPSVSFSDPFPCPT